MFGLDNVIFGKAVAVGICATRDLAKVLISCCCDVNEVSNFEYSNRSATKYCNRCFRFNPILTNCTNRRCLLPPPSLNIVSSPLVRHFSLVPVIVRSILKIRYLVLGGALGGGYSLSQVRHLKNTRPSVWSGSRHKQKTIFVFLVLHPVSKFQQYEEWKKNLPDTDWIKGLIPVIEADKFRTGISKAADGIKGKANEIDLDPALR